MPQVKNNPADDYQEELKDTATKKMATKRETRASKKQRLLDEKPQLPASAIADWIVPYLNRKTCNQLSLTNRAIQNEMKRHIWPWPSDVFRKVGRGRTTFAISPNGKWLASFSSPGPTIKIWHNRSNKEYPAITVRYNGPETSEVLFSPSNSNQMASIASSFEEKVYIWNIIEKPTTSSRPTSSKCKLGWELLIGGIRPAVRGGHTVYFFQNADISPNGKWIAVARLYKMFDGSNNRFIHVHIICVQTGTVKCLLKSQTDDVEGRFLKFCPSPDDEDIGGDEWNSTTPFYLTTCTGSMHNTFHIWKLNDDMISTSRASCGNTDAELNSKAIAPHSIVCPRDFPYYQEAAIDMVIFKRSRQAYLCTVDKVGQILLHTFPQCAIVTTLNIQFPYESGCRLAVSPDGSLLALGDRGTPRIHILRTEDLSRVHTAYGFFNGGVVSLTFTPNHGQCIVASGTGGSIYFWDVSKYYIKNYKKKKSGTQGDAPSSSSGSTVLAN